MRACVPIDAGVTRGALLVARTLERISGRS
jgi:hypothetical protein